MAGGAKETPRQRMVGMMYLVLTALLALQVSNSVLDKFIFIDSSLQHSITLNKSNNEKIMVGIQEAVAKNGGRADDKAVMDKAQQVKDATAKVRNFMAQMRNKIIEVTGGYIEENGVKKLAGMKDYDAQMAYTLGPEGAKNGEAYKLEKELNDYVAKLNELLTDPKDSIPLKINKIALAASEVEEFKNDPDQKSKDFAYLNFDHTPTVACMAVMSQIEQEVVQAESQALEHFSKKVGASIPKFDKIMAVANAESGVVAAGTKYKATLFLAASSSVIKPVMSVSAPGGVKVGADGVGQIEFMAKGGDYDKSGNSKRSWTGNITLRLPSGDTTLQTKLEYIVVKPVIQVRSASVQALYLNCGNELQVDVPALGVTYDPKFTGEGGEAIAGSSKGKVLCIPTGNKFTLTVYSSGDLIGSESFSVRRVPAPKIVPYSGGRPVDLKQGVSASALREIDMRAIPDEDFRTMLPKDARYRVTRYTITLARGRRAVATKEANDAKVNITDIAQQARPGDRIVIEVKEVQRMNFRDRTEKVPGVSAEIFTVPLD